MKRISESVTKKDHAEKAAGDARYIADLSFDGMLHAGWVRSGRAHARLLGVRVPPLPEGYRAVDRRDVPGVNLLKVVTSEQPIFAEDEVRFVGEAIMMIVGPDGAKARELARKVEVDYGDLPASELFGEGAETVASYAYKKGDPESAFASAASVVGETFETGYQEQAYIEPQGAIGFYEDGKSTVYGSMQCPYYVKAAVAQAMGLGDDAVRIVQATTGGAFGGKEDYPSLLGCQVAVAARACGAPVRVVFDRREDMAVTPKRHPSRIDYEAALDAEGNVLALRMDVTFDGGAYLGLSGVVLQRALIAAAGVYRVDNLDVRGRVLASNTVPNGAFRGFGAPQAFFALETFMNRLAFRAGREPLDYKLRHLARKGDLTATGGVFHHDIVMDKMIEKIDAMSGYREKRARYASQDGRYRRGIGLSLFLHGCGFTGSAEKDYIKSVIRMAKRADDTVEILASNTDMGQGLKTTFAKIASRVLGIPLDRVIVENPDTDRVPNSGPTVASRSLMIVGKLVERASERLRDRWVPGRADEVEEHYRHAELIPWDLATFTGDAYPAYSWGVNVVEVEVDTLLATAELKGAWGVFDVGNAIDDTIMRGQMEGGMLQAIGYGSIEKMENAGGKIRQASMTDYIVPTAMDVVPIGTALVDNFYPEGPFGAKGAGELTIIGGAPAYSAAVEQAAGAPVNFIPVTPERLMEVISHD